ncbi:MAG: TRAP transporter small permease [Treponema sp.]|jgi:TRAP-type C4-dicarboxylate transport system permease small subunit|nr:TRAP transporter small permease [Treponema sp.]
MLKRIYAVLNAVRGCALIAALSGMVGLCVVQIVLRYFTSASLRPFAWGDELMRLTLIWIAFLAGSVGVRTGAHLNLDYFMDKLLKPGQRAVLEKIILITALASMALLVWYGILQTYANKDQYLQNIPISVAWFYVAIPVGCFYIFIEYLLILIYGRHPFAGSSAGGENPPVDTTGF